MAQYVKATNFASKDALLSGDPNKIVKGTEIDDEFDSIQTAVNSKADTLSPTLTGTPLAPTATAGTNTTQVATTAFVTTAVINERTATTTLTNKTLTSPTISGGSVTGITDLAIADGGTGSSTASGARANLGLAIGTDVQAYDADLTTLGGLSKTDGNFIVGNGSTWVAESGSTARTSLGLGSIATQNSNSVSITGGSITGGSITGVSISGITDLAVVDGGTGASNAASARSNLGLVIGTDVAPVASPALTGTPTAPTASFGTSSTQIATTAFVQATLQAVYPVGSIYISTTATNPATTFGFGTWEAFGAGRVLVGQDTGDAPFDTLEETGGSKDAIVVAHTHNVTDAGHSHNITSSAIGAGGGSGEFTGTNGSPGGATLSNRVKPATTGISIDSAGSSGTNANLQPYVVVKMWKRTA